MKEKKGKLIELYLLGVLVAFIYTYILAGDDAKFTKNEIFIGLLFSLLSWVAIVFLFIFV